MLSGNMPEPFLELMHHQQVDEKCIICSQERNTHERAFASFHIFQRLNHRLILGPGVYIAWPRCDLSICACVCVGVCVCLAVCYSHSCSASRSA